MHTYFIDFGNNNNKYCLIKITFLFNLSKFNKVRNEKHCVIFSFS